MELLDMECRLSLLEPGEEGVVERVSGNSMLRGRLIDLGIIQGTKIKMQKKAPLQDPLEIKVKNFNLSLRICEAACIEVRRIEK